MAAHSVGSVVFLLAALAALGLDRTGYPVVSSLGDPIWILCGAALGVIGGVACGYGYFLSMDAGIAARTAHTKPAGAKQ